MYNIVLYSGEKSLVDKEDFEKLKKYKWYLDRYGYAYRNSYIDKKRTTVKMHRQIMQPESKQDIDHINGDPLDNRKINLRACTRQENLRNRGKQLNNKSGYKGVCWAKSKNKWQAQIEYGGKNINLGRYKDIKEAAKAYNEAAIKFHGKYAKLNEEKK